MRASPGAAEGRCPGGPVTPPGVPAARRVWPGRPGYDGGMWLLKTEPGEYSYQDLERAGRARWDGVKNPVALRNLRLMKEGDRALVYHTGGEKSVSARPRSCARPTPTRPPVDARLVVVDVEARRRLPRPVALGELKTLAEFAESPLVRQGRLSVVALTAAQWQAIMELGGR